ncbi:hypothetical protein [Reichenbachiella ulvae]|uniref:Uncharacterized protein n=1 Tax=Reichenbachiella ulvae TaxID=2980104 RepID=A0ABT3CT94_9BACT|nr:hypothetical protein [Reichenbachiella ulvae]MCV9386930.1 hypothetical protein [Reichenbachiella ulvae]
MSQSPYNIKAALEQHMPSFLQLLGNNNISWNRINQIFEEYIQKAKEEFAETQTLITREATFFSIMKSQVTGDGLGAAQFDFYDQLFNDLFHLLSYQERNMLGGTLKSILIQLEKDYLNFIGELAVLYFYKINTDFKLIKVEEKVFDNKNISADFLFSSESLNDQFLIEVVNIHLEQRKSLTQPLLKRLIEKKVMDKLKSKEILLKSNMSLQPLIWCKNYDQVKLVSDFYKLYSTPTQTHKSLSYISLTDKNGKFYHRINFADKILCDYDDFHIIPF